MATEKTPTAVLLSGSGRTLQNFIDLSAAGELPVDIRLVISSRSDAYGLKRAKAAGIPTHVVRRKDFANLADFSDANTELLLGARVELVALAGYLCLYHLPDELLGKVLNVHPALLPSFGGQGMYGHHVHEAVLAHGCKVSGCTVHVADNEYDHGPIVVQRACPVLPDDDADALADRVFEQELIAYPEAIRLLLG